MILEVLVISFQILGFVFSISCGVLGLMVSNRKYADEQVWKSNFYQGFSYFAWAWAFLAASYFPVSVNEGIEGVIRMEIIRVIAPCMFIGFLADNYHECKKSQKYHGIDRRKHGA